MDKQLVEPVRWTIANIVVTNTNWLSPSPQAKPLTFMVITLTTSSQSNPASRLQLSTILVRYMTAPALRWGGELSTADSGYFFIAR